jgi:hypothetical protein
MSLGLTAAVPDIDITATTPSTLIIRMVSLPQ